MSSHLLAELAALDLVAARLVSVGSAPACKISAMESGAIHNHKTPPWRDSSGWIAEWINDLLEFEYEIGKFVDQSLTKNSDVNVEVFLNQAISLANDGAATSA